MIKWVLNKMGLEIVPSIVINNLKSCNEKVIRRNIELQETLNTLQIEHTVLSKRAEYALQIIADNKFLPSSKPNLDLAAKTIVDWGNPKTIATFLHKLMDVLEDSHIETAHRYVKKQIKKRKLEI